MLCSIKRVDISQEFKYFMLKNIVLLLFNDFSSYLCNVFKRDN